VNSELNSLLIQGYRKNEMAKRFCIFWTGSPTSGAFGGILAGAIIKRMNGTAGLFGWQWLFIIGEFRVAMR